jgi:hypothetical protein
MADENGATEAGTGAEDNALMVFSSENGDMFAVPLDVIETYRVPEDQKELLSGAEGAADDDVSGYFFNVGWVPPRVINAPAYKPLLPK